MKKKYLASWITFLIIVTAVTLVGCGSKGISNDNDSTQTQSTTGNEEGNESEGGKKEITFLGWGSPTEVKTFETLIEKFEAQYLDVKVNYISVPASDFDTKLQTMIAGGKQPDVFYLRPENVMPWADNGRLYDISSYVNDNEIFDESNVWAKAIDMYRYDGNVPGIGNIYGLPKDIGPFALAYNKDLFEEAGIPDPDPDIPWTWDEFLENAKKLTKGEGTDKQYGTATYSLESAIWSNGADWLDESKTKVTITDSKFIEAMQWVVDLALVHGVMITQEDEASLGSFQRWIDGKIGMMGIGPWSQAQFWEECEFEWDLMPWPTSPSTGENAVWYGGMGYGVSPNSLYIEESCNLAAFLAFNEDAQVTNYQMGQAVPNFIDMTKDGYLKMTDKAPENKQEFIDIIEDYGRRATQTYTYNSQWFDEFNENAYNVWVGDMTAEEFCKSEADTLQSMLDEGIQKQMEAREKNK